MDKSSSTAPVLVPTSDDDKRSHLTEKGGCHLSRFGRLGEVDDINKAVEYMSNALTLTPEDHINLPSILTKLGKCYGTRFERLGKLSDIESAIKYETRALSLTPNDHPDLSSRLVSLGISRGTRYQRLGGLDDLDKAAEYMSTALSLTAEDDPDLPHRLSNLGVLCGVRFQRMGELGDLEKAIEFKSRALTLTTDDHPDLLHRVTSLGVSHSDRFRRLGQLDDLEKAIECKSRAVALTPGNHPHLPDRLTSLGLSYRDQFQRRGKLGDLEKAIECDSRALALTPNGHPHLPRRLTSLGASYSDRFKRLDDLDDLEKSIEYKSRALESTPNGHPDLPHRLVNLGVSHSDRFERLGGLADLDKAIGCMSRALSLTPKDHPHLPHRLTSLGVAHGDRFKRLGELDDLEKSIEYMSRALSLTPDNHTGFPQQLANLGVSHSDRFRRLGQPGDLEKAIECHSRAVALSPNDHPQLPHRLTSLGGSYADRFKRLGELTDLDKAIESMSHALSLTFDDHPDMPFRLRELGLAHSIRFRHSGCLDDILTATTYASRSVSLTPDGHSSLPFRYHYLAQFQFIQSQATGDLALMRDSLHSFRSASQTPIGSPRVKFTAAQEWATFASKINLLEPIEAYQTTVDLLPQFIWVGATTNQRYQDLDKAKNLAACAASAAIQCSEYMLAIEWLEHARCVVWNQSLTLRSPLDELQSSHPDLATRLQTVANQLHHAGTESRDPRQLSAEEGGLEEAAQQHRLLAQEYNDLLSKARQLPGYEDFLKSTRANALIRAARNGPIVVINCDTDRCDALIIQSRHDQVTHVPLPNFSLEKARQVYSGIETAVRGKQLRERGERRPVTDQRLEDEFGNMLATLWYDVVKPVLDQLGFTNIISTSNLPHITWCPTGPVSFLPLHAAGDYDQPGSRVFDHVISSYTPTLTALLASTPSSLCHKTRVLAVGQESTPGHTRLPGTTQELEYVQAHVVNEAQYTQLVNEQATTTAVLDAMEQHDWVHLACHAHQNVADATQSGFFLHDGTLDLAEINRRSFKNKGLAFLSACQTAMGDEKLPDEAVHLASGVLMAGYTSVIATMWSVHDEDAPVVADKVYAQLMKDGKLGNGEAGKALHNAVSELREQVGEKEFGRWVPYIHIGS